MGTRVDDTFLGFHARHGVAGRRDTRGDMPRLWEPAAQREFHAERLAPPGERFRDDVAFGLTFFIAFRVPPEQIKVFRVAA